MEPTAIVMELIDTEEYQPLLTGKPQTRGMRSGRVYLRPGQSCGEHSTGGHEEQLVFLAGSGTAYWGPDKNPVAVGVGKVLYFPPQMQHNIHNTGTEPLVYIYCVIPVKKSSNNE
jgi:mannose-6-phosphate isomerase-like protein (cupin superfamily)